MTRQPVQEDPTVARDLEEASLVFMKTCFDYNATSRPKSRLLCRPPAIVKVLLSSYIMDELVAASCLPTWTNIAYHKYYADGNKVKAF